MSLAYHLSPDARLDLADLNFNLQEDVLDEMDRLCDHPEAIGPSVPNVGHVHFLDRDYAGTEYVLRLRLDYDRGRRLSLLGVVLMAEFPTDLP